MTQKIKDKWLEKKAEKKENRWEKKKILSEARPAVDVKKGDMVSGRVYNVIDEGAFVVTPEKYIGFIHNKEMTHPLTINNRVEARVTFVREDGKLNLSLRPVKETARIQDAERILEYLKRRKGSMPYSDETPAEIIMDVFQISKAAFKRALGKLLKEGLVEQKEGWVSLTGSGEE